MATRDIPVEDVKAKGDGEVKVEKGQGSSAKEKRQAKVSEYMTKDPICFTQDMSLKDAVKILLDSKISGAPVVEKYEEDTFGMGKLVGVLTEEDLLWKEAHCTDEELADAYLTPFYWTYLTGDESVLDDFEDQALKVLSRSVGMSMNEKLIFVTTDTSVTEAAGILLDSKVRRLPVVAPREGGKAGITVVGVISRKDILKHVLTMLD